jgi:branched-chain amino acid transport system permease protein
MIRTSSMAGSGWNAATPFVSSGLTTTATPSAAAMLALVLRYNGPSASMSFEIMVDSILLMTVIGGMGTLYGPMLGAIIIVLAQYYMQSGMAMPSGLFAGLPVLPRLFDPDRWLLWTGVLFAVIVYFFPAGIVGRLRERR